MSEDHTRVPLPGGDDRLVKSGEVLDVLGDDGSSISRSPTAEIDSEPWCARRFSRSYAPGRRKRIDSTVMVTS
ncbi:hypothetical protein [Candidatus Poriferisodalis sp.]|uniref:hypothetical protein n=1 Tax=Candidatus Poriferisodalis sp. TaxID=3101277 RepID=UPI003B5C290A